MTPSLDASDRFVVYAIGGSVGIVLLARLVGQADAGKGSVFRVVFGGLVASVILVGVADANENLAKGFALLVLVGALLTHGTPALTAIRNATTAEKTTALPTTLPRINPT